MANERLADLTTADVIEYVNANPGLIPEIAKHDPRVKLMEVLYKNPEHRRTLKKLSKAAFPDAEIAEVDLPAEFEAKLGERDKKIEALEKRLDDGAAGSRYQEFRSSLRGHAEALDETPDDAQIDEIIAFMKDNDFGVKSSAVAVAKFYETRETAKPTATDGNPLAPQGDDEFTKKLLASNPGDDLYELVRPDIERMFNEEIKGGTPPKRRPVLA